MSAMRSSSTGMHISPYEKGNIFNKDPLRIRKLLLHDYEIRKLEAQIKEKGYTLVPLQVYFKGSLVKSRSVWHAVKNCMINGRISQRRIRDVRRREISKLKICIKNP